MSPADEVLAYLARDGSLPPTLTTLLIGPGEDLLEYAERLRREEEEAAEREQADVVSVHGYPRVPDEETKAFLERAFRGAEVVDLDTHRQLKQRS